VLLQARSVKPAPERPLHARHDEERDADPRDEHNHRHGDVAERDDGKNRHLGEDNRAQDQKIVHTVHASEECGPLHRQVNFGQALLDLLDGRDVDPPGEVQRLVEDQVLEADAEAGERAVVVGDHVR